MPLAAFMLDNVLVPLPVAPDVADPLLEALADPLDTVCDEPPVLADETGGEEVGIRELW